MNSAQRKLGGRTSRGFTLVEMMIVVVIVSILAMLAVVGYRKMVASSRMTEATHMVQAIRVAQEAYHAETQTYLDLSPNLTTTYPAASPVGVKTAWGAPCGAQCKAGREWTWLPVHVDGPLRFGYATTAGTAADALNPANVTVNATVVNFPAPVADWFIVAARGDTDGNGTFCNVYSASFTNELFIDHEGE